MTVTFFNTYNMLRSNVSMVPGAIETFVSPFPGKALEFGNFGFIKLSLSRFL